MRMRPYQTRAVQAVRAQWAQGHRAVCLVAPTGAGKTVLGTTLAQGRVVWLAHRRELVAQAAARLTQALGPLAVSTAHDPNPAAPVFVSTVQSLVRKRPPFEPELVVLDECHHYRARDWAAVVERHPSARLLGLTATPERADGKPLGDMFESLVVAAQYSELLAGEYLVPCRIWRPTESVAQGLAQDPLAAYQRYAPGERAFVFVGSVRAAHELARRAGEQGIPAAAIEANTPTPERDETLRRFAGGEIQLLTNVYALTEGVDVPAATTVVLARACAHVGLYLQIAGRVLRPAPGKTHAKLIDLVGASLEHGAPTDDRDYSLDGEGIRPTGLAPLRNCLSCGACYQAARRVCPSCGWEPPAQEQRPPRIYDLELQEVFAGASTPDDAKQRELVRLMALARERSWSLYFVQKEYEKLFGAKPELGAVTTEDERTTELAKLLGVARSRGYKEGWAAHRYKQTFGAWPSRSAKATALGHLERSNE